MPFPNATSFSGSSVEFDDKAEFKIWDYNPSIPAAAVGAGVCGLLTLLHVFRLAMHKTLFCIPFIIGAIVNTFPSSLLAQY
jgi:hypothetical protein